MIPATIRQRLAPVLGDDIARSLATIAEQHKIGAACSVSVPSWVLVKIAESMVELTEGAK